jgi:hypothetical protein
LAPQHSRKEAGKVPSISGQEHTNSKPNRPKKGKRVAARMRGTFKMEEVKKQ